MAGLPPAARLRSASDFAAVRDARGQLRARHFLVRWVPGATGRARIGLAVSRKVSRRAVQRNRIKRVARESFRISGATLPLVDVLVIARPSAAEAGNADLRSDLDAAWARLQALKLPAPRGTIGG